MIKKLKYLKYYGKVLLNNWKSSKDSYAQHGEDQLIELLLPNGVNSFLMHDHGTEFMPDASDRLALVDFLSRYLCSY